MSSNARYAKNMRDHFKILLIQVKNLEEKKRLMEQFDVDFLARDKDQMWKHVGYLVRYNQQKILH
jgi:hypothetical protein